MRLGKDMKLYATTTTCASGASQTWTEIRWARDVNISDERETFDASCRGSGIVLTEPTMRDVSIEFDMFLRSEDDADFDLLNDAYVGNTLLAVAIANGPIATAGTIGAKGDCKVTQFRRREALRDGVVFEVVLKPAVSVKADGSLQQWEAFVTSS